MHPAADFTALRATSIHVRRMPTGLSPQGAPASAASARHARAHTKAFALLVGSGRFSSPSRCIALGPPVRLGRPDDRWGRHCFRACVPVTFSTAAGGPRRGRGGPAQRGASPRAEPACAACQPLARGPDAPGRAGTSRRRGEPPAPRRARCACAAPGSRAGGHWEQEGASTLHAQRRQEWPLAGAFRLSRGGGQQPRPDTDDRALRFTQRDGSSRQ